MRNECLYCGTECDDNFCTLDCKENYHAAEEQWEYEYERTTLRGFTALNAPRYIR